MELAGFCTVQTAKNVFAQLCNIFILLLGPGLATEAPLRISVSLNVAKDYGE